jgi:prepilin-type N-terminal cleavage/methylation domain-containing protein
MKNTLKNSKNKAAFTLAEVLITLGIIGIVAAMTIPTLLNNYKAKRYRSQFLKAYSTVQQAFRRMEDEGESLDPTTYATGTFYKVFGNYLSAPTYCSNANVANCYYPSGTKHYKTLDGNGTVAYNYFDDGQILLQDGTLILFENYTVVNRLWVSVDLNGFNNPPNRWGYDLFTFQFIDGELQTMGGLNTAYPDTDAYCNLTNSKSGLNGIACAQKAKAEPDYFKWVIKNIK